MVAILEGRHPGKPRDAQSLGFSGPLWELVQSCWSKEGSDRPTAQQLFDHLSNVFNAWVPPVVYPAIEGDADSDSSGLFPISSADSTSGV